MTYGELEEISTSVFSILYELRLPLILNAFVNLFTMYGDFLRRINADTYLIALDSQDGDRDIVADHDALAYSARQN